MNPDVVVVRHRCAGTPHFLARHIDAAIVNAGRLVEIRTEDGSFKAWLDKYHPAELADWVKLFRLNFKFTGPEIVREFLVSSGYLPGAHRQNCPVYAEIARLNPPWMRSQ